jgi:hypothetical protein
MKTPLFGQPTALWIALAAAGCAPLPRTAGGPVSCDGLETPDPVVTAFYEPGTVYRAVPVRRRVFVARAIQRMRTLGAELSVQARPGLTRESLERSLFCHVSQGRPAVPDDPLHPATGRVAGLNVRSAPGAFVVAVLGDGPAAGADIWRRARALAEPEGSVEVQQLAEMVLPDAATQRRVLGLLDVLVQLLPTQETR